MNICGEHNYRYWLSFDAGSNYTEVFLSKIPSIKYTRQENSYQFRRQCSDWKLNYYQNKTAYGQLIDILDDYQNADQVYCKIERWENDALVKEEWVGYITLNFKVNEDDGWISFQPTQDVDFAWYDENKSLEVDPYSANIAKRQIKYDVTSIPEEYYLLPTAIVPNNFISRSPITPVPDWAVDTDYDEGYTSTGWVYVSTVPHYYKCSSAHRSTYDTKPGVGPNWGDVWDQIVGVPINVVQQRTYMPATGFDKGNGTFEPGYPNVTSHDINATNCPADYFYKAQLATYTNTEDVPGDGYFITDILTYFVNTGGFTLTSAFLNNATNPVTFQSNKHRYLPLIHKTELKAAYYLNSDETDINYTIKFDDLMQFLSNMYDLCWDINGTVFRIEHRKFYEYGYAYAPNFTTGIDLTDTSTYPLKYQTIYDRLGGETDNVYEYKSETLPEKEEWRCPESGEYHAVIQYNNSFIKKGEVTKREVLRWTNDVAYVFHYPASVDDDGYCLMNCELDGSDYKLINRTVIYRSYANAPYLTTRTDYPCGDLYFISLLNDFWIYNRYFKYGTINGTAITFSTMKNLKQQRELIVPRLADFNPDHLVYTNLGYGHIREATLNLETDFLKITCEYE